MFDSDQVESGKMAVPCALFKDGDGYKLSSLDGKMNKTIHLVDAAPQCRFVKRQKEEMPFFYQVYYDEGYNQTDLEEHCRSHGLTETSPEAYIQHCKDAHPCLVMRFQFPPGGSLDEFFNNFPDLLKSRYLAQHQVQENHSHYDYWFDNMGTPIFFEGEKAIPSHQTGNQMETMVDSYFVVHLEEDLNDFHQRLDGRNNPAQ